MTAKYENRELDRELSDALIAISVVSRRLADKVAMLEKDQLSKVK
jgi:vacuolar-type H+-ATPase subunit B/Vma2